jgi:hypothetical protein
MQLRGLVRKEKDNTEVDLKQMKWGDVNWNHMAQGTENWQALVNTVMTFRFPKQRGEFVD